MNPRLRAAIFVVYALLAASSIYLLTDLRFGFDFASFFPQDDPDLEFFLDFIEEFESDDNFLLVAVEAPSQPSGAAGSVFDTAYLNQLHAYTLALQALPGTGSAMSLTKLRYPVKTPFGLTSMPALHRNDPGRLPRDSARIMADERFVYNLISPDASTMALVVRTVDEMSLGASDSLMQDVAAVTDSIYGTRINTVDGTGLGTLLHGIPGFDESPLSDHPRVHLLGRAYFQSELVKMQKREVTVSTVIAGALVTLILILIYQRWRGVLIAMVSIALGLLLFFGLLSLLGRELNAMAALYPVLMVIVGTSDVVHLMTKYVDELRAGKPKPEALRTTLKEIGLATFLTSATTAIGFATLLTSRVQPIRDFGLNAGLGVLVAYVTVVTFTMAPPRPPAVAVPNPSAPAKARSFPPPAGRSSIPSIRSGSPPSPRPTSSIWASSSNATPRTIWVVAVCVVASFEPRFSFQSQRSTSCPSTRKATSLRPSDSSK